MGVGNPPGMAFHSLDCVYESVVLWSQSLGVITCAIWAPKWWKQFQGVQIEFDLRCPFVPVVHVIRILSGSKFTLMSSDWGWHSGNKLIDWLINSLLNDTYLQSVILMYVFSKLKWMHMYVTRRTPMRPNAIRSIFFLFILTQLHPNKKIRITGTGYDSFLPETIVNLADFSCHKTAYPISGARVFR